MGFWEALPRGAWLVYLKVYDKVLDIENDDNWQEAHEMAEKAILESEYCGVYLKERQKLQDARNKREKMICLLSGARARGELDL